MPLCDQTSGKCSLTSVCRKRKPKCNGNPNVCSASKLSNSDCHFSGFLEQSQRGQDIGNNQWGPMLFFLYLQTDQNNILSYKMIPSNAHRFILHISLLTMTVFHFTFSVEMLVIPTLKKPWGEPILIVKKNRSTSDTPWPKANHLRNDGRPTLPPAWQTPLKQMAVLFPVDMQRRGPQTFYACLIIRDI